MTKPQRLKTLDTHIIDLEKQSSDTSRQVIDIQTNVEAAQADITTIQTDITDLQADDAVTAHTDTTNTFTEDQTFSNDLISTGAISSSGGLNSTSLFGTVDLTAVAQNNGATYTVPIDIPYGTCWEFFVRIYSSSDGGRQSYYRGEIANIYYSPYAGVDWWQIALDGGFNPVPSFGFTVASEGIATCRLTITATPGVLWGVLTRLIQRL